jgi:RNA polymerase sigma factor (TIGR02999 family)
MTHSEDTSITLLLQHWSEGDPAALAALMPLVYDDLLKMAQAHLRRERPGHTLQRTGLVHEAFLKLVDQRRVHLKSRAHFLSLASQLMRRILVDHARARQAEKRGAGVQPVSLEDTLEQVAADGGALDIFAAESQSRMGQVDLIAVDRALTELEQLDAQQGRVVELRFFGGLTIEEAAEALDVSEATVKREWAMARAWLQLKLAEFQAP